MNKQPFSIYDKKSNVFSHPFTAPTPGAAERMIMDAMVADDSQLKRYPEDFALYTLGSFEDDNGQFLTDDPELLVEVSALVA